MSKQAKRFSKGQTVFYASTNLGTVAKGERNGEYTSVHLGAVITRTIDSCGAKQMTFEDHGCDSVFGKSVRADHPAFFATAEEAFAYLHASSAVDVIAKHVYTDHNKNWFYDLENSTLVMIPA
jgi:hypothetical protein